MKFDMATDNGKASESFASLTQRDPIPREQRPPRCEGCPYQLRMTCGSRGPRDARVVVVAESPGDLEEKYGFPLIGPSGRLLEGALPKDAPEILYLNAIQCYPGPSGGKNQRVLTHATAQCRERLMSEILEHERDMILVLGKFAAIAITGRPNVAITKVRGQSEHLLYDEKPLARNGVFYSVHPSYLLHGGGNASLFYGDIKRAFLEGTFSKQKEGRKQVKGAKPIIHNSLEGWLDALDEYKVVACDIETTGFNHQTDRILWLGAYGGGEHFHAIRGDHLLPLNGDLYVPGGIPKMVWQNGKFDRKFLRHSGLDLPVDEDTMLQSYVLNEQQGNHDLDSIALHYTGLEPHKDMVSHYYKGGRTLADAPEELVLDYLGKDLQSTLLVYEKMSPLIKDDYYEGYYNQSWKPDVYNYDRLMRAADMLTSVEENGILIDQTVVARNKHALEEQLAQLQDQIEVVSEGMVQNPGSTQQVQAYLFDYLDLPRLKASSDKETLERLVEMRGENEFISLLLEHRRAAKLYGTYVNNVPRHLTHGRIHSTFLLHGTITGRLASRNPNVENIPREGIIRNQFTTPQGKVLLGIDLNQAELRALACLSGDENLCAIYNDPQGKSIHDEVAKELFGTSWDRTPEAKIENKIRAKSVNFGIIYGRSGADIAKEFKLSKQEGNLWLDRWFERFPQAKEFLDMCAEAPLREQTIISPFGNKKRPQIISHQTKQNVQNKARNFLPQNIASNLILDATTLLWEAYQYNGKTKQHGWNIINLIHDETLFEVNDDIDLQRSLFEEFSTLIDQIAKRALLNKVPFICEAKIGTHWGSLTEQDW